MFGVTGTFLIEFAATFCLIGIAVGLVIGKVIDLNRRTREIESRRGDRTWST